MDLNAIEEINKRLTAIDINVGILINKLDLSHKTNGERFERVNDSIARHERTLYGNGNPGLTTKIERMKDLEESMDNHSTNDRYFFTTIIGILILILGKMFINF